MRGSGWLVFGWCAALLAPARGGLAQEAPDAAVSTPARVQILCYYSPELAYQASVLYSAAAVKEFGIDAAQAKQDLTKLALGLGYDSLSKLHRVDYGKGPRPFEIANDSDGLSIGFRLTEAAFHRERGTFKLEPFVAAYQRYGRIDLEFLVTPWNGTAFAYRGLGNWDSPAIVIRHHANGGDHSFRIAVLDRTLDQYDLPPFAPPALPLQAAEDSHKDSRFGREQVIFGIVAAGLSIAVFLLVFWGLRRWERPKRGRRRGR